MAEIGVRLATAEDIQRYYGEPQRMTLQALVITLNGVPSGIVGLARQGTVSRFFSEFREELRPHLSGIRIMRAVRSAMDWVRQSRTQVYALAQCDEPDAHRILARLGFQRATDEVYLWPS